MRTLRGIAIAAVATAALGMLSAVDHAAAKPFKYRSYGEMAAYLLELNATYPGLLRVEVAQDKYGLPYPTELTCGKDDKTGETVPCKHYVVHMTNHSTLAAQPARPQVFFSGALHGDERIGPITTIEMIALVAKLATAYVHPHSPEAEALRAEGAAGGASIHTQRWVHHLVNSRDVVLTPMTNAYGYANDVRTELDVDPNRDYNYMRADEHCMKTMTSRVVNEIWREHMFQLAITFHGGMRAISYEWGSPNHYSPGNKHRSQKSPDDAAQAQLAHTLAVFAGAFRDDKLYPTGTMNDIVYGVAGGMEDWGYAASWENDFVTDEGAGAHKPFQPCTPTTFGGYAADKTVYNNVTHRAFNILVETSNNKHPDEDELGQFEDLYNAELDFFSTKTNGVPMLGHVSQNVRLALMLLDMVQPYVRWVHAPRELPTLDAAASTEQAAAETARDLFPSASLFVKDSQQLTSMGCGGFAAESTQIVACNSTECRVKVQAGKPLMLQVAWEVLGALTVDKTRVQLASSEAFSSDSIISQSAVQKGATRRFFAFSDADSVGVKDAPDNSDTLDTSLFVSCVDLHADVAKTFYMRALATVDQGWRKQAENGEDLPSPHIPPQSHYVNARTNAKWNQHWNGRDIKGSLEWFSPTITVTIEAAVADEVATAAPNSTAPGPTNTTTNTTAPAVATTTVSPAMTTNNNKTPPPTTASPSQTPAATNATDTDETTDDADETEDGDDNFDDDVATEPGLPSTAAPSITTASPTATTVPSVDDDEALNSVLKNDAKAKPAPSSSLLSYGYLTLGLGGLVIAMTLTYMYKRVFRSQRRTYMNINNQRPPRSTFGRRGNASPRNNNDDDEEEEP